MYEVFLQTIKLDISFAEVSNFCARLKIQTTELVLCNHWFTRHNQPKASRLNLKVNLKVNPHRLSQTFLLFWDAKAVQKIVEEGIEHEKKCQSLSFTKPELSLLKGYCGTVKMTCKICHEQISTQSVESIDDDLFNQCSAKTLLFSSHLTFEFTYFFPFFLI